MMAEILTVADLERAKQDDTFHAEVITGKLGGNGADIDFATHARTGQTQTTLPKVLSNVGFSPAGFDFTTGGTLTERDKAIFYQTDGNWYSWGGTLPKVVPPASSPASTGGIADNAWNVSTSAFMYRDWEGFTAELLAQAGIVDDGQPDEIGASQRVDAIRSLPYITTDNNGLVIPNSIEIPIQSRFGLILNVRDVGMGLGGDDTVAWNALKIYLDTIKAPAHIPMGTTVRLQAGTSLPVAGVTGVSKMTSKIEVITPVDATVNTLGIIYGAVGEYSNSYANISNVTFTVDNDSTSPIVVLKINTVSRGAGMRDCTIHCGTGACVGVEDFYYFQFDNVTFEGRYIQDDLIGPSNKLQGVGFKQLGNREINNIQFNKCNFLYLKDVFSSAGNFVGSNAIGVYNTAFEKIGRGLGSIAGWNGNFTEGYIEKIGLNGDLEGLGYSVLTCGAGNVSFKGTLLNFGSASQSQDLILGILGTVRFTDCNCSLPAGFTGEVIKQITYSSKSILILENSPILDLPDSRNSLAIERVAQQWVGGYGGSQSDATAVDISTAEYSRNRLKFLAVDYGGDFALNERIAAYLYVPVSGKFIISIDCKITHKRDDNNLIEIMQSYGVGFLSALVNTDQSFTFSNVKNGAVFDSTFDAPFVIKYSGQESNGYRRYNLVFTTKTGTAYARRLIAECELNAISDTSSGGFFISGAR